MCCFAQLLRWFLYKHIFVTGFFALATASIIPKKQVTISPKEIFTVNKFIAKWMYIYLYVSSFPMQT